MSTFQILKCPTGRHVWASKCHEPLKNTRAALPRAPCPVRRRVVYVMQWHFLVQYLNLIKCDLLWFHFIWFDLIWCSPSLTVSRLASCRLVEQKQQKHKIRCSIEMRPLDPCIHISYVARVTSHDFVIIFLANHARCFPLYFFGQNFNWFTVREHIAKDHICMIYACPQSKAGGGGPHPQDSRAKLSTVLAAHWSSDHRQTLESAEN